MTKDHQIHVRVTEMDKRIIQKAAESLGVTMSEMLRQMLVRISADVIRERRGDITQNQLEDAVASSVTAFMSTTTIDIQQLDFDDYIISTYGGVQRDEARNEKV